MLFKPAEIGRLKLHNRLIRSATAERMADRDGIPRPALSELYRDLTLGDVGLIITGHMYVHERGKCHPEMTGIDKDERMPGLKQLAQVVHEEEGRIAAQINHGGGRCSPETVSQPLAPSSLGDPLYDQPAQKMTSEEIEDAVRAYAAAAGRAKSAGFDAVQIHGAHGYLVSQFLSPLSNQRDDPWGGSLKNRARFLWQVCRSVRQEVGSDYPVLIKFGITDGADNGLTLQEGLKVLSELEEWGLDAIEISVGFSGEAWKSTKKGVTREGEEAYLLPLVKGARGHTELPLIAVGGYRSRKVMERVLLGGWADFISLSRPLIREPHLPARLKSGEQDASKCISSNNCWPEEAGVGIGCKCPPPPDQKG